MTDFIGRYQSVLQRIEQAARRGGRDPASIRLIAVTKTVPPDRIREAVDAGIRDLGENRLQEAQPKIEALADLHVTWHFIGRLQTNKAKKVAEVFDWVQSIDRLELVEKLDQQAPEKMPVLVEVKLHAEDTKSGAEESVLTELVSRLRRSARLDLRGLMAIPPFVEDVESVRPYFRKLRELAQRYQLTELSMGMSHDFDVAIEEGATMVRVGTALFGDRE
jgi:pyridoxal phosphate enzyme (YggS family)